MSPEQHPAMLAMFKTIRDRLTAADVTFTETTYRDDAISFLVNEPGEYWEIDVLQDGSVDVEVYASQGLSDDPLAAIDSLIDRKTDDTPLSKGTDSMSLKIRLSRWGAKKRPVYRIVVADARAPRDGRFIENLGTFDPLKAKDDTTRLTLNGDKAKAWIAKGAQPTDRVQKLLAMIGAGEAPVRHNPEKAKPKKKAQERAAEAEKLAAAAPAAE